MVTVYYMFNIPALNWGQNLIIYILSVISVFFSCEPQKSAREHFGKSAREPFEFAREHF